MASATCCHSQHCHQWHCQCWHWQVQVQFNLSLSMTMSVAIPGLSVASLLSETSCKPNHVLEVCWHCNGSRCQQRHWSLIIIILHWTAQECRHWQWQRHWRRDDLGDCQPSQRRDSNRGATSGRYPKEQRAEDTPWAWIGQEEVGRADSSTNLIIRVQNLSQLDDVGGGDTSNVTAWALFNINKKVNDK